MKTFVVLPTYNEHENIIPLIQQIFHHVPATNIVVVDDNSPDGTSEIVKQHFSHNSQVHLITRTCERGRGTAGIVGFQFALENGADAVVEMDADLSHDPKYLPNFFHLIQSYDVVTGSRFVQGGKDVERGWLRRFITFFANTYMRLVLELRVRDCTSGYRCFKAQVLKSVPLDRLISKGPSIVQETVLLAVRLGFSMIEIPITFVDRKKGATKLTYKQLVGGFAMILRLRFFYRNGSVSPRKSPNHAT